MNTTTLALQHVHHKPARVSEDSTNVQRLLQFVGEPVDAMKDTSEIKKENVYLKKIAVSITRTKIIFGFYKQENNII